MPPALRLRPCLRPRFPNGPRKPSNASPLLFSRSLSLSNSILSSASPFSSNPEPYGRIRTVKCRASYAVLGAGFAGLSVAWHLLKHGSEDSRICVDVYDEVGIGGGASGASGGLLHPYSPKAKVLWRGAECWQECLKLIAAAEEAAEASVSNKMRQESSCSCSQPIVLRRGILRPATEKNLEILKEESECSGLP